MRSFSRRIFVWLSILLILIGVLNYLCRKKLPYGYADVLSYNQIYYGIEQLHIASLKRSGKDSLVIEFEGSAIGQRNHFEVYSGGIRIADQWSSFLTMKPAQALTEYAIKINSTDSLTLRIEFPRDTVFPPEITTSSILIGTTGLRRLADWCNEDPLPRSPDRAKEADALLQDSMKITPEDNSVEKVTKIAKYILLSTAGKYGIPSDSLSALHPIDQLNCVRAGRSMLLCGNYGRIFSFFSNRAGVPARCVASGLEAGGVVNGPHVFDEAYLKEQNQWAYVDLTDGNVFVKKNDQFLNAVDLLRLLRYHTGDSELVALHFNKDGFASRPFGVSSLFAKNAFNYNNKFTFYYGNYSRLTSAGNILEKIRNFFFTGAYYAVYSDNIRLMNDQFYLRLFSSYLLLMVFLAWFISVIHLVQGRIRSRR